MTTPPQQANWVACRASCRNSGEPGSMPSPRVIITLPRQKAGAGGTGSRYPVPVNKPSALRLTATQPRAATPSPARVEPLARLTACRTASQVRRSGLTRVGRVVPVQPLRFGIGDHRYRPRQDVGRHRQVQLLVAMLAVRARRGLVVLGQLGQE